MATQPRTILIADPDEKFLGSLRADPRAASLPPTVAARGGDAQQLMADTNRAYSAIFLNPKISEPGILSVIRFAHLRRPATPIYLIYDGELPFSREELKHLAIHDSLAKPIGYADILKLVAPSTALFDTAPAKSGDTTQVGAETSAEDAQFVPIRAGDFLSGSKAFFDVYVRLGSSRYVKILQAGDSFSRERVQGYIQKGVEHFYLRKEEQERYLAYCDKLTSTIVSHQAVPDQVKVSQTLNHGQETMNFLKQQGVSEVHLQYAQSFADNVHAVSQKLVKDSANEMLAGFLKNLSSYEHGVAVSMIASLLYKPLGIQSERAVHVVGLAALLHDIGLYRMSPEIQDEDESKMTQEQIQVYHTHPSTGAAILRGIHGIDAATIQAVSQHHERRNRMGFPARIGATTINRVAEIVGISDEYIRLIAQVKKRPLLNPAREMELAVFEGFSSPVVEAFRTIFMKT